MAYRSDKYPWPRTILELALDLRMWSNGSMESDPKDVAAIAAALEEVIKDWKEPTSGFDGACKLVVLLALEEYRRSLRTAQPAPEVKEVAHG